MVFPPLYSLSLGYFLGLLAFHTASKLSASWFALLQLLPDEIWVGAIWAVGAFVYCKILNNCQRLRHDTRCAIAVFLLGALCALLVAGVQAAQRKNMQIPVACHGKQAKANFELLENKLVEQGQARWISKVRQSESECLVPGARLILMGQFGTLMAGNVFEATVQLKAARTTLQMSGFDVHAHWFSSQIAGFAQLQSSPSHIEQDMPLNPLVWMERLRNHFARWLQNVLDQHPEKPLLLAMVIGDQGLIATADRDLFAETGIAHLVAISGLHITLFAFLAGELFARFWRRSASLCNKAPAKVAGACFGMAFAILYGLVAGWGVPAQRTVFMLAALLASRLVNSEPNPWDTFFVALLLSLLSDSWAVLDTGFYLSFVAVGTLIFSSHARMVFVPRRWPALQLAVKAQYAATLGLLVPCAALFNQQSIVSPLVNALSIPWMSFVSTPLALLGSLFHQEWAVFLAADSLQLQRNWLNFFGELDWRIFALPNQSPWVYGLAQLGALVLLLPKQIVPTSLGLALVGLLLVPFDRIEEKAFRVDILDVGQGTAVGIRTRNHVLIYDTGPAMNERSDSGRRVILPWLLGLGTRQFDALWVSHDDNDHSGGAAYVLAHTKPAQFVSSFQKTHALNVLANQRGAQIANCHSTKPWRWDGVLFEPIAVNTDASDPKASTDNNQSCVLRVSNDHHSILLTGDVEKEAEQALLQTHPAQALRAEFLLSPHHGSKTSSTARFLDAVEPSVVIVQSGWMNRYHHPHPSVITRYHERGTTIYNTAQVGALQIEMPANSETARPKSASQSRRRYWHLHENRADPDESLQTEGMVP